MRLLDARCVGGEAASAAVGGASRCCAAVGATAACGTDGGAVLLWDLSRAAPGVIGSPVDDRSDWEGGDAVNSLRAVCAGGEAAALRALAATRQGLLVAGGADGMLAAYRAEASSVTLSGGGGRQQH